MTTEYMKAAFMLQGTLTEYSVFASNLIKLLNLIGGDTDTDKFNKLPKNLQEDIRCLLDENLPSSDNIEDGLDSAKFFYGNSSDINACLARVEEYYRDK